MSNSSWGDLVANSPCRTCANRKAVPETNCLYKCEYYPDGYFDIEFRVPDCKHCFH
ncbi:hypothetical protein [uncultured Methanolobus sp.]|uniref:hypothetical protein n=1 Tax=uncultured Methanolobus sp. TaxID=218300 RepID=UPI002AAB41AE|nr:hypothetical protein [uncultured Methanolobus sp.]